MVSGPFADAISVAFVLLPGFICFRIATYVAHYSLDRLSDLQTTIYSLFFSLLTMIPTSLLVGINTVEEIDKILSPSALTVVTTASVLIGLIAGLVVKYTIQSQSTRGSPWDAIGRESVGKYAIVLASDGKQYLGWINLISSDDEERRELVLGDPKTIERAQDGSVKRLKEVGKKLLFTEDDIKRVIIGPGKSENHDK
jgi:hypothetical protein